MRQITAYKAQRWVPVATLRIPPTELTSRAHIRFKLHSGELGQFEVAFVEAGKGQQFMLRSDHSYPDETLVLAAEPASDLAPPGSLGGLLKGLKVNHNEVEFSPELAGA